MPRLAVVLLGIMLLAACGSNSPTGPKGTSATESRTVSADLRNRFLFEHNAGFNGGRTFRWIPPIPIAVITSDDATTALLMEQFLAWEGALAGAGGVPFYEPQPVSGRVPSRGIFFAEGDLPGNVVGLADPFSDLAKLLRGEPVLRRSAFPAERSAIREVRVPETTAEGEIQRCVIVLDPIVNEARIAAVRSVIRHEIGHCLGFLGHVSNRNSVMHASACCPLTITADVRNMMRTLYNNPPGTEVTR
jgi:hypothetical protein